MCLSHPSPFLFESPLFPRTQWLSCAGCNLHAERTLFVTHFFAVPTLPCMSCPPPNLCHLHSPPPPKKNTDWVDAELLRPCRRLSLHYSKTIINVNIWCGFYRASSLICGNKMPTRCNRGFYCRSYCLINMFRASLCPSIIQWLLPVVFRAVVFKLLIWCGAEGYVCGLQDAMPIIRNSRVLYGGPYI